MIDFKKQRKDSDARVQDKTKAIGFAINPGPIETKTFFYAWKADFQNIDRCIMVLCNVLGSAMWLRYPKYLIIFNQI